MGELLRVTVCRNWEFMVTLFVSRIRPILDYCSCVCGMCVILHMFEGSRVC